MDIVKSKLKEFLTDNRSYNFLLFLEKISSKEFVNFVQNLDLDDNVRRTIGLFIYKKIISLFNDENNDVYYFYEFLNYHFIGTELMYFIPNYPFKKVQINEKDKLFLKLKGKYNENVSEYIFKLFILYSDLLKNDEYKLYPDIFLYINNLIENKININNFEELLKNFSSSVSSHIIHNFVMKINETVYKEKFEISKNEENQIINLFV